MDEERARWVSLTLSRKSLGRKTIQEPGQHGQQVCHNLFVRSRQSSHLWYGLRFFFADQSLTARRTSQGVLFFAAVQAIAADSQSAAGA